MSYFGSAVLLDEAARTDLTVLLRETGSTAVLLVLDRSGHEDVRLHQPRCANASAYGLQGYVVALLSLVAR